MMLIVCRTAMLTLDCIRVPIAFSPAGTVGGRLMEATIEVLPVVRRLALRAMK